MSDSLVSDGIVTGGDGGDEAWQWGAGGDTSQSPASKPQGLWAHPYLPYSTGRRGAEQ